MIKYQDLKAINKPYEHAADDVLQSGWYLKGKYTERFEAGRNTVWGVAMALMP